jgi:D-alanine transaminase
MSHGWNGRRPAGRIAYVDGRYVRHGDAGVHIEDRGLQLGDAVYEVCLVSSGLLMDESEHLDRLERSLREIEVAMPMPRGPLALVMREVVRRNGIRDGLLYLQVTRGAVRRDHPIPSAPPRPTLMLTARSMDVDGLNRRKE